MFRKSLDSGVFFAWVLYALGIAILVLCAVVIPNHPPMTSQEKIQSSLIAGCGAGLLIGTFGAHLVYLHHQRQRRMQEKTHRDSLEN